jgi:hypothetical protein
LYRHGKYGVFYFISNFIESAYSLLSEEKCNFSSLFMSVSGTTLIMQGLSEPMIEKELFPYSHSSVQWLSKTRHKRLIRKET